MALVFKTIGGLEYVGHSFAYVAHFVLSRDICAGIFKQSMGAWNREGIGLSYWPARLCIGSLESILRFLKSVKNSGFGFDTRELP